MFVNNLLAKDGLKPTDVSIVGVGTGAGAFAALGQGRDRRAVQSRPGHHPTRVDGQVRRGRRQPHREGNEGHYGGDYHASVIYITDEFIKKNPNTVQAVGQLRWCAPTAGSRRPRRRRSST
jgi:NitT/TauT family transport system substrate-binding protein